MSDSTALSPLIGIWTDPRRTVRSLMHHPRPELAAVVVGFSAILASLDRLASRGVPEGVPLTVMFAIAALLGPVFGVLVWYLHAWAASLVAAWLGGDGDRQDIRAALAFGELPATVGRMLMVIPLSMFGTEWFTKDFAWPAESVAVLWAMLAVQTVLAIYATVLRSKGVGEACGFSAWRGWASLAIPYAIVIAALLLVIVPAALLLRR